MILSITGFMGCGKSSVGRRLSQLLCCRFMDLDEMIEKEAGKSIPEIFAEEGEKGFREMELAMLSSILSARQREFGRSLRSPHHCASLVVPSLPCRGWHGPHLPLSSHPESDESAENSDSDNSMEIISLGGGTVMTRECAEIVRERTVCAYLRASAETLAEHLEGETQGRPMLKGNVRKRITELMAQRSSTYESTAHIIIDIDGKSVDDVAQAIIDSLSRR
jgi:shikimate kinase